MKSRAKSSPPGAAPSRHRITLRGRLFVYLLLFSVIMLGLLWLMQIAYLDQFYERIKTRQIEDCTVAVAAALDDAQLQTVCNEQAQKQQVCISVYKVYNPGLVGLGMEEVCRADILSDCTIHHMSVYDLAALYKGAAGENGNTYELRIDRSVFGVAQQEQNLWQRLTQPEENGIPASLIHAKLVRSGSGDSYLLLLNSSISPVSSTVTTLRMQLLIVSVMFILLALVLSSLLARRLARPIIRINREAARLATGDFSGNFDGHGYREVGELAETLNFASTELARAGQVQQDIVANVSHDLRTPLTMIGGYAEFMRDFPDEDHSESIQVIIDEVDRLNHLVQDVLDESRLSSGVEELRLDSFDFTAALRDTVNHYNALLEKDGYQFALDVDGEVSITADEQRLMQAVGNLLNNALTHCGADKRIRLVQQTHPDYVRVEVHDNGPGIAAADLPLIWQRYYRTDAPQRKKHGSGLGLAIVKGVMELHHARYGVDSTEGVGSVFWFELPR